MKTDLREMFVWTTLIAFAVGSWKLRPELGVLCTALLVVAVLARMEAFVPSPLVIATALLLLLGGMMLLGVFS